MTRGFKLRSFVTAKGKKGQEYRHYSFTVPNDIAERIPDTMRFTVKMTEDGILYEPATQTEDQVELPSWLGDKQNKNGKQQKRPSEGGAPKNGNT